MRHALLWIAIISSVTALADAAPFKLDSDEFPIGMFSIDSPGAIGRAAEMKLGYIHTYANGHSTEPGELAHDRAYLDAAQAAGLRVMFNLHGDTWVKHPDGVNEMLKIVNAFKDHPALGFWFLCDEPDGTCTPAQLQVFYEAVKRAAPQIPIAVCNAWTENWFGYQHALDILMTDIYPVNGEPFPHAKVDHVTNFAAGAVALGKPVMPINQCFNWRGLAGQAQVYRGAPVAQLRTPNEAEVRYWCYAGLCQGVRGMFWWGYSQSVQTGYSWIDGEFAGMMREFAEFTRLVAPAHKPVIFERARDDDVFMALWSRPGGTYLVMVNAWPLERPLSRGLEGRGLEGKLTPVGRTRATEAKLEGGTVSVDKALPWEAFVWKVEAK